MEVSVIREGYAIYHELNPSTAVAEDMISITFSALKNAPVGHRWEGIETDEVPLGALAEEVAYCYTKVYQDETGCLVKYHWETRTTEVQGNVTIKRGPAELIWFDYVD